MSGDDVLVLRALGLGDLLCSVPAMRGLRRAWPGSRLVLAAPGALGEWLASFGLVDAVVPVGGLEEAAEVLASRVPRPAVAVNLHGRGPASHAVLGSTGAGRLVAYSCPAAGHRTGPTWVDDEHEVDRWARLSESVDGPASAEDLRLPAPGERSSHVVVHPGAAFPARRWPAERWADVAATLADRGHRVVVTGTAGEAALCATVAARHPAVEDHCARHDLDGLGRLVGTAALVLSADTGVAHVATAFATPSVTLFGPVSPALWGPRVDLHLHRVLWRGDLADPRPGDPHGVELDARLAGLGVADVVDAATDVLHLSRAA